MEGDPKRNGWRGIDKELLERFPVPLPRQRIERETAQLTKLVEVSLAKGEGQRVRKSLGDLEMLVSEAYQK